MLTRIEIREENWGLICRGIDPTDWYTTVFRDGTVKQKTVTENYPLKGKNILDQKEWKADSQEIENLFDFVEKNFQEITRQPGSLEEVLHSDGGCCDGSYTTIRFFEGRKKVGQASAVLWHFPLGEEIEKRIAELKEN